MFYEVILRFLKYTGDTGGRFICKGVSVEVGKIAAQRDNRHSMSAVPLPGKLYSQHLRRQFIGIHSLWTGGKKEVIKKWCNPVCSDKCEKAVWGLRNWSKAADVEETLTQEKLLFLSLSLRGRMLVMLGMRGQ